MRLVRFQHLICAICGMAWKETERGGPYGTERHTTRCPRCGVYCSQQEVVKISEETYP